MYNLSHPLFLYSDASSSKTIAIFRPLVCFIFISHNSSSRFPSPHFTPLHPLSLGGSTSSSSTPWLYDRSNLQQVAHHSTSLKSSYSPSYQICHLFNRNILTTSNDPLDLDQQLVPWWRQAVRICVDCLLQVSRYPCPMIHRKIVKSLSHFISFYFYVSFFHDIWNREEKRWERGE
jgi:hypothetical protein